MKTNDLAALRRTFYKGQGERAETNPVLLLCDEVEQLRAQLAEARRTNAELAKALSGHLHPDAAPEGGA